MLLPTPLPPGVEESIADPPRAVSSPSPADSHRALGARIRAFRAAARMSQTALAEAVGVSYQRVQEYESGKDRVAAVTLQAIAAMLEVGLDAFSDETPTPAGTVA